MKHPTPRDIRRPRWRKRSRWWTSLHEAGHAAVYLAAGGRGCVCHVFPRGGVAVFDDGNVAPWHQAMIHVAGRISAEMLVWRSPPAGRFSGRSRTKIRLGEIMSDGANSAAVSESIHAGFLAQGIADDTALEVTRALENRIEHDAKVIIYDREEEIVATARRLFRHGRVRVWGERPASVETANENKPPADVPPVIK